MRGDPEMIAEHRLLYDRPCDTCKGKQWTGVSSGNYTCNPCDGTGRHTFALEYDYPSWGPPKSDVPKMNLTTRDLLHTTTLNVHIEELLPIVDTCTRYNFPESFGSNNCGVALHSPDTEVTDDMAVWWWNGQWSAIDLPASAVSGMYVAFLSIH
jgi:hypothetical protein